jgi:hypothetical protein
MSGGYQQQVYNQPAIGVAGDRANQNPIATYDAGPGGLVADSSGVLVGNFCWVIPPTDPNGTGQIATQTRGVGNVAGLLYNDTQALNTTFLSDAGLAIPGGLPVALATQGDFIVINTGSTEAQVGMKCYATFGTGAASFAAPATPTAAATSTGSTIAAATFSVTGSIANDILTVTAVGSGTVVNGGTISGTGVATGTQIASQLSGTTGGVGTYLLTVSQQKNIVSETISGTYGLLTIGTLTSTPTFAVGQTLTTAAGVTAGTSITQLLTGAGGSASTFAVNISQTVGSGAIASVANVETKWYAASAGGPGQAIKITSWVGSQG